MLLHVVDLSAPDAVEQCQAVEDILTDLRLMDKPRITALNKIDLLLNSSKTWSEQEAIDYLADQPTPVNKDTVLISASKRWGLTQLLELVSHSLTKAV